MVKKSLLKIIYVRKMNKELTTEELDLIFKGVRPEGMEYSEYKEYRKLMKSEVKKRLKGTLVFVSSTPEIDEDNKLTGRRLVRTYKKSK